jgi:cysteine synthase A
MIAAPSFAKLSPMIGNTPLLAVKYRFGEKIRTIYAKAENLNLTGSIKDRMALFVLERAYASGKIKRGDLIAEATSGNTGIAFSAIGRAFGHPVTIFMPDWMSAERKNLIRSLGATIVLVSKEQGGFLACIALAEKTARERNGVFLPCQFDNSDNVEAHYRTTGPEIWLQLKRRNLVPDAFVAGVGTGGTVMGVGKYLREKNPKIKIHPLEPANSPTMSTGHKVGKHRIQGISDEFVPAIVKLDRLDSIVAVDDGDSIIMAQRLAAVLGLGVGISSGANFLGAVMLQNELGGDAVVVTVFSDDNKKYLSTDLMGEEPAKPGFLSPGVELLDVEAFKRVCTTCCTPEERCVELEASSLEEI